MPPGRVENDATQRNDQYVAGVDRRVADDADQDNHRRHQPLGRDAEQCAQAGIDESGVFGDADAEHRDQHDADRVKVREVGDQHG